MASQSATAPPTASEQDQYKPRPGPRQTGGNFVRLAEAFAGGREPTAKELEAIEDVLALAREFDGSPAQVRAARNTTNGRQRFLATRFTPPSHPDFAPLMRLLDALIAAEGEAIETNQGLFVKADIQAAECWIAREDGREVVCFPIRYPWAVKPDPDKGVAGVRASAVYRSRDERKPIQGSFQVQPGKPIETREPDWWEVED